MSNIILALMQNDSPDKFANDVANAYFANPDHVRRLLNADCINECVDYVLDNQKVEFDLSDLDLFNEDEPLFSKPSRQRGKRKHNKKAVRRKGSAKRFKDRSRKCAAEGHAVHVYHRGMVGDWNYRGRRLEEIGAVSTASSHKIVRDTVPTNVVDDKDETRSFKYEDGTTISCTMSQNSWIAPIWDKDSASYTSVSDEWKTAEFKSMLEENPRKWHTQNDDEYDPWEDDYDFDYDFDDDDDEIIGADCTQEQDTAEFSAVELAQITMRIATADPAQRARIRSFMATI